MNLKDFLKIPPGGRPSGILLDEIRGVFSEVFGEDVPCERVVQSGRIEVEYFDIPVPPRSYVVYLDRSLALMALLKVDLSKEARRLCSVRF